MTWEVRQAQLRLEMDPAPKARRTSALTAFHVRDESPAEALAGEVRAKGQEALILAWLRGRNAGPYDPWEIATALGLCINSCRRALTMLTRRGLLIHDGRNRVPAGPYGQRSGTWRLA